jgi:hypothetical protein
VTADKLLWVAAIVCWLIAAFGSRWVPWPGLVALGLVFAGLTHVI